MFIFPVLFQSLSLRGKCRRCQVSSWRRFCLYMDKCSLLVAMSADSIDAGCIFLAVHVLLLFFLECGDVLLLLHF